MSISTQRRHFVTAYTTFFLELHKSVSFFFEASAPDIGIDILKHEYNGAFNTENFSRTSPKEFFTQFEECLAAE